MKKTAGLQLLFLAMGIMGSFRSNSFQTPEMERKVIAFYNLENLYDTLDDPATADEEFTPRGTRRFTSAIQQHKLSNLSRVISELGPLYRYAPPEVLAVAEIENSRVLQQLIRQPLLAQVRYQIVHYESPDSRGIDVALLYQPRAFRVIASEPLSVALPGGSKEARFTRDILYVKGLMMNDTLHLLVNHWPSRRGGEVRSAPGRAAAAKRARQLIDSLQTVQPDAKVIVLGDLNDDPDSKSITRWLGASGKRNLAESHTLFNPWFDLYKRGIGTLANKDRWGLFDQILLSRSWLETDKGGWQWEGAGIYRKPFMVENIGRYKGYPMRTWDGTRYRGGFSDHFPTFITVVRKTGKNS